MKARAIALVLAAGALAALLFVPGGAAAATKPASRLTPPSIDQEILEQGSNGFLIKVSVHDRHRLELSASKIARDLAIETATYTVPFHARPGSTSIHARLGALGRIDMRFIPDKVKKFSPSEAGCKGDDAIVEEGTWTGLLAFHGEHGFTQVRVHNAFGTETRVPQLRCRPEKAPNLKKLERELEAIEKELGEEGGEEAAEAEEDPQELELVATARRHRIVFAATREAFGSGRKRSSSVNLIAGGTRMRGRIKEAASVLDTFAPGSIVRPANSLEPTAETTVKAPEPFSGSAVYRDPPKAPVTWTGDLKVDLPIFGVVRLAGPGTRATMCEGFDPNCGHRLIGQASSLLQRLPR